MVDSIQRVVPFYGDELVALQQPDGVIYVLFTRLCDNLGIDRRGQTRRVMNHSTLSKALVTLPVETEGGPQRLQCLRLDQLPLWLATLNASRVKAEIRPKLERYQDESAQVLWNAFRQQILPDSDSPEIVALQRIAEQAEAIAQLARQQIALTQRVDTAARKFRELDIRVGMLEDKLQPATYITDDQAAEVSSQVKALAELMTEKDSSKNHYQGIFAELYRRFGVSSYKNIRQGQYKQVLGFLEDWRKAANAQPAQGEVP